MFLISFTDYNVAGGTISVSQVLLNWEQIMGNVTSLDTGFIVLEHDLFAQTVDLATGRPANAQSERSDVTAVPAMGVIAEALTAIVLADAMLEKFGGDSLVEMRRNFDGYVASLGARWSALREAVEG